MLLSLVALLVFLSPDTLGSTAPIDQVVLSSHANMSNTDAHDIRASLGDCDIRLRGHGEKGLYLDRTQSFLRNVCGQDTNCNLHSGGCWGFYVVRTCFANGDDQRVAQAMRKLDTMFDTNVKIHRAYTDPLNPTYLATDVEVMRRFHNILIDNSQLRDASISDIRSYLDTWFASMPEPREGPRFTTFILLDSQVVNNLNQLPENLTMEEWLNLWPNKRSEWVKLVDVDEDDGMKCRVWIWDLFNLWAILIQKDHGVADVGKDEAQDGLDWEFYSAV